MSEIKNRIQGMVRSMDQWRSMVPVAVATGSMAQVEYALADAKTDIEALWRKVATLEAEIARLQSELEYQKKVSADRWETTERQAYAFDDMRIRAESAEARLAEVEKALDGLLEPFEGDDCRYDHHGYCQAHFLQEGDECCSAPHAMYAKEGR